MLSALCMWMCDFMCVFVGLSAVCEVRTIHAHRRRPYVSVYVCWTSAEAKLHCDMQLYHQLVVQPLRVWFGRSGSRARSCRIYTNIFLWCVHFCLSLESSIRQNDKNSRQNNVRNKNNKKPLHTQSYVNSHTHACMLTYSNEQQRADSNNNHE